MTIMYTVGMFILSLAFVLSLFNIIKMIEEKSKIWILPILVVGGTLLVLCAVQQPRLDKYYDVENPVSYQDLFPDAYKEGYNNGVKESTSTAYESGHENGYEIGYEAGYEAAIKNAVLIEVTDNGYIISFNGEDNFYVYNNN